MRKPKKKYSRRLQSVIESLETRRLLASINIADFGARPNDGIDDTAAIRAAINASKPGDTILFTGGIYDVSQTIELKSNRTYTGGGTLKRAPGQDFILTTDGQNTGIKINNLTLDGGGLHAGNGMARNMEVTNTRFQNITRGYPTGNAILLSAGAENSKFNNNTFYNVMGETGIYGFVRFHNVEMNNNYFDTVMEGIHLWYESGENLQVKGNTFIRMKRMAVELQGYNARGIYVENNKASEWKDRYHESFFLSIVNQGYDIVVRNNHGASGKFGQIDPDAHNAPVGLEISGWGVLVEGNVIEGFREGLHLMNIRDAVVRNNTFYNQTWMAIWRTGVSTGQFNGTNLRIENNTIYNPKTTAFMFHGSSSGWIGNNKITLFGGQEYWDASGSAFNNVTRAGNQVTKGTGNPQPYTGPSPVGGNQNNPAPVETAPASPSDLSLKIISPTQIDLTWKDNANNETGYKVFRRVSGSQDWVLIATLDKNATTYKDGTAQPNTTYIYRVQAYNATGHSGFSNEPRATTPEPAKPAPVVPPAAPTGLKVTPRASTQLDVSWEDRANNETSYKVFRREAGSNEWVLIATLGADANLYKDGSVQPDREYYYRVQAVNSAGVSGFSNEASAKTPAEKPTEPTNPTNPPADQAGSKPGLLAEYFDNLDLTNRKGVRVDSVIDFNWGLGSPMDGIAPDTFSVRWTGMIEARYSEEYTFYAGSDDGVRVWIDDKLIIDSWYDQRLTEKSGKIKLEAGKKYNIRVEYYENQVGAQVYLKWSSKSQAKEIVPASALSHPSKVEQRPHVGNGNGLLAEYFDNKNLTGKKFERIENVNFDWRYDAPSNTMGPDTFSVRWTGQILAQYSEEYTFYTTSDDGVRLWIDGKLIIDDWVDHSSTTRTGKIKLEAGKKYDIRLEYYENEGVASVMLGWSSKSQPWEIVPKSQLFAPATSTQPAPSNGVDLARGKKAVASSAQDGMWHWVDYLTDGNDNTRWASTMGRDGEWIYVDLGAVYSIDRVRLNWETAYAKSYVIQVSNDAKTWTTIYQTNNGDGGIDDLKGLNGEGRYVRMVGLERGYPAGFSLWSMEVYGA